MRLVQRLCFVVLASSLMAAQTSAPGGSGTSQVESDVKKLLEAVAAQQKQITEQQVEIERLKQQLTAQPQAVSGNGDAQPARVVNASLTAPSTNPAARSVSDMAQGEKPKESPLSFRIGGADFTPGGFVDFENVFRSTNTGNGISTNFATIPFSNTAQGRLTEFRTTAQFSRFNLKTTAKYGQNDITGFIEFDFNGNDANNVFVTSNSHTDRLRHYWLDLKRGKWEFLGGQTWGLLTANRNGVSAVSSDVFTGGYNEDANHQVGANYTRAAQFRAVWHPNSEFAWAFAIENAQQYVASGQVLFPAAFSAIGSQFEGSAANGTAIPNLAPDFISKLAYDTNPAGKHFHAELGGVVTTVKAAVTPVGGTTFHSHSKTGGGFEAAVNYELLKNLRVVANGLYGNGVGRYLIGLGPQTVIAPVQTGAATFDINPSLIHAGDGLFGFELQATPKTQFGVYYGGAYFQRNAFPDITAAGATKPIIGFGGATASAAVNAADNRAIQEGTIDWIQTFWRNPQYGAVLLNTQYSYLTRSPWFVPAGQPKNAHLSMAFVSLRYVLP